MAKPTKSMTGKSRDAARKLTYADFFKKYQWVNPETGEAENYDEVPVEDSQRFHESGLNPMTTFQLWLDVAHDYGKPTLVSSDEFDKLVESGAVEIFRGMPDSARTSGEDKLKQVMYEDAYYAGNGKYGDGLYFAESIDVAANYAANHENHRNGSGTGAVVRAVLKPGSKTIDYGELNKILRSENPDVFMSYGDKSVWARSHGYDAITAVDPNGGNYVNVINRSALIISDNLGRAKKSGKGIELNF